MDLNKKLCYCFNITAVSYTHLSRKKLLDKITLDDLEPSSRRYPYVGFKPEREVGNDILFVEGLTKTIDGVKVLDNVSFMVNKDDKIAFIGDEIAVTTLFKILNGEMAVSYTHLFNSIRYC